MRANSIKSEKSKTRSKLFSSEAEPDIKPHKRSCDHEGCKGHGEYRAPKSPDELNSYYYFCLDHVRDYNARWNYFKDFSSEQLDSYLRCSFIWDMPTWRSGIDATMEDRLKTRIYTSFFDDDKVRFKFESFSSTREKAKKEENFDSQSAIPEVQALEIMGLEAPTDLATIKRTYKILAKKYHPDINKGIADAEDKLKQINAAYSLLKVAYAKYEKLIKD